MAISSCFKFSWHSPVKALCFCVAHAGLGHHPRVWWHWWFFGCKFLVVIMIVLHCCYLQRQSHSLTITIAVTVIVVWSVTVTTRLCHPIIHGHTKGENKSQTSKSKWFGKLWVPFSPYSLIQVLERCLQQWIHGLSWAIIHWPFTSCSLLFSGWPA